MADYLRVLWVAFFTSVPHYLLCSVPFFPDLRVRKRTVVGMIIATGAVMSGCYSLLLTWVPDGARFDTVFLIIFYTLYMIQYKIYFRISFFKLAYVFLVVQAYSQMLNLTAKFIDVRLFPENMAVMGSSSYGLFAIGLMVITYPFLFRFFKNTFSRVFHEYPDRNFWKLCITPVLFFVMNLYFASMFQSQSFAESQLFILYLLLMITGFITYYLTLRTGVDMANVIEARSEMENQLALQAQHYKQLTETIEHARAARHDLRHHLSVISAYVQKGDTAALQDYLDVYIGELPEDTIAPYCMNYAVDAVVRHYLNLAKQTGAELDICFRLPPNAGVPDSDLCIVFGNILENAAESCRRQQNGKKFIRARCDAQNGRILLVVDNSGDRLPQPGRAERYKGQGVGLRSVQVVAEKWNGSLEFVRAGNVYKTSVILLSGRVQEK